MMVATTNSPTLADVDDRLMRYPSRLPARPPLVDFAAQKPRLFRLGALTSLALALGCGSARSGPNTPDGPQGTQGAASPPEPTSSDTRGGAWPKDTRSPVIIEVEDAAARALIERCGKPDARLGAAASQVAERLGGGGDLVSGELAYAVRSAGSPYVRPRLWSIQGGGVSKEHADLVSQWVQGWKPVGQRRCGLASIGESAEAITVVVAADVLADLEPLATRARVGQWIEVSAELLVKASDPKLVVLGPRGKPKGFPTQLDGKRIRSRFNADQPGRWLVQIMASANTGPRPVAEAFVFAGVEPPAEFQAEPAPGESAYEGASGPREAIFEMLNAARKEEGLSQLRYDARLANLAQQHAISMRKVGNIGHDVGQGSPEARVRAAGLRFKALGENVARAASVPRAHRALWASPSHRGNMLLDQFDSVGIGAVVSEDGSVWVCQLYAGR